MDAMNYELADEALRSRDEKIESGLGYDETVGWISEAVRLSLGAKRRQSHQRGS